MAADPTARPRRLRAGLTVALLLVAVWAALAGAALLRAGDRAQAGIDRLESAQRDLHAADVLRGEGLDAMRDARDDFRAAHAATRSPVVVPLRVLPVLGRQIRSVDALTGAAATVTAAGADATASAQRAVRGRPADGAQRLALLDELHGISTRAGARIRRVRLGPSRALVGPLADARGRFATQLARIDRATAELSDASVGLTEVLRGPARYVLFAASNAEMRSGSGMWLLAGDLRFADGRFALGEVGSVTAANPPDASTPIPPELAPWVWTRPNEEIRNLAFSPDLAPNARLAAALWARARGGAVDGVLVLDPVALRGLLAATGPVEVEGRRLDVSNVLDYLLAEQYRGVGYDPGDPEGGSSGQSERHAGLSQVARAVITRLDEQGWDAADLLDALGPAAAGRHVLAWSPHPTQDRAWRAAGVGGEVPRDALALSIANVGANKLDPYLVVDATVAATDRAGGGRRVTVTARVRNDTPTGLGAYAAGPSPLTDLAEGEYAGVLTFDVPAWARSIRLEGADAIQTRGRDGPARMVAGNFRVSRGATRTFTLRFDLPQGRARVSVRPSARVPATTWHHGSTTWRDEEPRSFEP
ncbi:MAG: DUF4012 domain-containing protein [Actinomycetes bacterium]